ncbi:hypothetical protein EVAR_1009_1 [Eumeta japonica]|uniref:Uncharacterized protein n=1 Tax=Eumeta variegata TaxID=151549 RepID=A0A4C1SF16_EUMVA|nr:hypothetical protein EVAR_1009_1 [Eumeta japonica]
MKPKTFDALLQTEVEGSKYRIVRTKNKIILLFTWGEKSPFFQACSLLSTLGDAGSGEVISSRTISVDAASFEIGEVVDRLGCIKESEVYEVVVYKDRERAAKSLPGVKSLYGADTSGAKTKKSKVPTDSKMPPTRAQKKKVDPPVRIVSATLKVHKLTCEGILGLYLNKSEARLIASFEDAEAARLSNNLESGVTIGRQGWQNATGPRPKRAPAQEAASSEIFFLTLYLSSKNASGQCSKSEELDFTKSIPELPDAAPDTSVYQIQNNHNKELAKSK